MKIFNFLNTKNTLINTKSLKNDLEKIGENQYFNNNEYDTLKSFDNLIKILNEKILYNFFSVSLKKCLLKICLNTSFINKNFEKNPIIYFVDYEINKIYYLEFYIGTENVYLYSYDFCFDNKKYKNEYIENINFNNYSFIDINKYIFEKKQEYIYNLIFDSNTKWNKEKLKIYISNIDEMDSVNNPNKYFNYIKDILYSSK